MKTIEKKKESTMLYIRLTFIGLLFSSTACARNALESVQDLHKNVGNSLLAIRKQYPESQTQVYTTIDQISKLCEISKKQYAKHKSFKSALNQEKEASSRYKQRLDAVALKLQTAQQELEIRAQRINDLKIAQEQEAATKAALEKTHQELVAQRTTQTATQPSATETTSLTETPSTAV